MNPLILDLMRRAASANQEEQRESILQIAMLLEKHSTQADQPSFYAGIMPSSLASVTLSADEERELITELGRLLESDLMSPEMLWALGKSNSYDALQILLTFLRKHCEALTEDAAWQALVALENFLTFQEDGRLSQNIALMLDANNPVPCLKHLSIKGSGEINEIAKRIVKKIEGKIN